MFVSSSPIDDSLVKGERFRFGNNWSKYIAKIDDRCIREAEKSLLEMIEGDGFKGKAFLDAGSGSGLFSLAARNLGSRVYSFDYDPQSVKCASTLKELYYEGDTNWQIETGSLLDEEYIRNLGKFDFVYCWGVLHHTGAMYEAMENISSNVKPDGWLCVALYNDQGIFSKYWKFIKRQYVKYRWIRPFLIVVHLLYPVGPSILIKVCRNKKMSRGMSAWYDLLDWLGGYPFETCKPDEVLSFFKRRGFILEKLKTVGGKMGCNEFSFRKVINSD